MKEHQYDIYHYNDIYNYNSVKTSITVSFVKDNYTVQRRKIDNIEKGLRFINLNINGVDHFNLHAPTNDDNSFLKSIESYSKSYIGFIYGDFNSGLYLANKNPLSCNAYKSILNNGYTDLLICKDGSESMTNIYQTCIDHVLDKGISIESCKLDTLINYSDHYPIILKY